MAEGQKQDEQSVPKSWKCDDPYKYPIEVEGDHWENLLSPVLERDRAQCDAWKEEVQNLLIFAGLFSAIVTAFAIVSYPGLQPDQNEIMINLLARIASRLDNPLNVTSSVPQPPINIASLATPPPPSSVRINILWFVSLVLSLTTALVGIVTLQWLREHQQYPAALPAKDRLALFNIRAEGLEAWYVPQIFSALPLLLQMALTLFLIGLIDFLFVAAIQVAVPITILIGMTFLFLILTTTLPALQLFGLCLRFTHRTRDVPKQCPYKSPQSGLFRRLTTTSRHLFLFITCSLTLSRYLLVISPFRLFRHEPDEWDSPILSYYYKSAVTEFFKSFRVGSWLLFDRVWLDKRDEYASSIFRKEDWMKDRIIIPPDSSDPLYDLTRAVLNIVSQYPDLNIHSSGYLAIRELSLSMNKQKQDISYHNGARCQYFQGLLMSNGLTSSPITYFSLRGGTGTIGFFADENCFIFLSLRSRFFPQHFFELHIRIINSLYNTRRPQDNNLAADPLLVYPEYSNNMLWKITHGGPSIDNFREQYSLTIRNIFEFANNPGIGDETVFSSLSGFACEGLFMKLATLQARGGASSTLSFISSRLKHYMDGELGKRSDFFFYMSCKYLLSLLWHPEFEYPLDVINIWSPPSPREDTDFMHSNLPVLSEYLNQRGTPDVALTQRLEFSDVPTWWDFPKVLQGRVQPTEEARKSQGSRQTHSSSRPTSASQASIATASENWSVLEPAE